MILETVSLTAILNYAKLIGEISSAIAFIFGVFGVINWIKNKFININDNVIGLKNSMDTHMNGLRDDIKDQTRIISTALQEQRSDFRAFYNPNLYNMHTNGAYVMTRAKRTPAKKKKKKD